MRTYAIGHADCHEAKHLATKWIRTYGLGLWVSGFTVLGV